jgi:hypothetical protein
MKRILFLSIMLIAFTILSGCNFNRTPSESPSVSDATIESPSSEPSLDPIVTEIIPSEEPVLTVDDLYTKFHEAEASEDYILALGYANQIMSEYPEEQRIYWLKTQMLISCMVAFNNELRKTVDSYSTDNSDHKDFIITFKDEYSKTDLSVEWPFIHDYADGQINIVGSSGTELSSGMGINDYREFRREVFCVQGDWVYYINAEEGYSLYKMKTDFTSRTLLTENEVSNLNVIGDWIYFTDLSKDEHIYKMRTDGSMQTFISDAKCSFMVVYNDYIYYADADSYNNLCRMKADGTGIKNLGHNVEVISISDNLVYFRTEQHELLCMTVEGTDIKKVVEDESYGNFYINEDSIHYMTIEGNGLTIYKCDKLGQNKQQLYHVDYKINFYYVMDTHILMSVRYPDRMECLVLVDLNDTANVTQLKDYVSNNVIHLKDQNKILFMNDYTNFSWLILNLADNTVK